MSTLTPRGRPLLARRVRPVAARPFASSRLMTTEARAATHMSKREGTIADAFASLSGHEFKPLDARFAALKASLIQGKEDAVIASWRRLLNELRDETAQVAKLGSSIVPTISFDNIKNPSEPFSSEFRKRGVAVIRGVIPPDEALALKEDLRAYISANPHTKAFPAHDPCVYELYWSPTQVAARADPRLLEAQRFVLQHWHTGNDTDAVVSLKDPIAYADRLRMRRPGDAAFALGPHVDGGSCERWEPEGYGLGAVYDAVFRGDWERLDAWDVARRLPVVPDLYGGIGACSAFRACQGWLSISDVGPFEGTLLVNPMLKLATAYYLLRPFFTPKLPSPPSPGDTTPSAANVPEAEAAFLSPDNWALEAQSSVSPSSSLSSYSSWLQGATPGHGQELRPVLHPHLHLPSTMVHVPRVAPGDYVVWHCDTIHAVDALHRGSADSSVLYIPACPLTEGNAHYLRRQRATFLQGHPSPDFGGGEGESRHVGRSTVETVREAGEKEGAGQSASMEEGLAGMGARAMGLEPFVNGGRSAETEGEKRARARADQILGFA